jgi:hypothetical protein
MIAKTDFELERYIWSLTHHQIHLLIQEHHHPALFSPISLSVSSSALESPS